MGRPLPAFVPCLAAGPDNLCAQRDGSGWPACTRVLGLPGSRGRVVSRKRVDL